MMKLRLLNYKLVESVELLRNVEMEFPLSVYSNRSDVFSPCLRPSPSSLHHQVHGSLHRPFSSPRQRRADQPPTPKRRNCRTTYLHTTMVSLIAWSWVRLPVCPPNVSFQARPDVDMYPALPPAFLLESQQLGNEAEHQG